ncbi:uncharacterized protein LOC111398188 [Olea europaea var. sylvestris]|uniref:uncharacterized protein LOC111398188 n=1 Tax=Olea europaea var. sylvestris TaxID=158386 RepID=UPI000C1CE1CD|nr:uncharacterized protein LOC111398188 [Olea europaea var. sylvestris]
MSTNLDTWQIFVDGASNSSGSGVGVIIINPDKHTEIQCALRFEFEVTNNEAEYETVVIALELALSLELEFVKVFSDSQLVVGQIEGSFERKDEKMSLYYMKVQDLQRKFKSCEIAKIARKDNEKADALSRLVFMGIESLDRTVHMKVITEPSINQIPNVMGIDNEPSWMDLIIEFITNGNLPSDARCLRLSKPSQALFEVHEGVCRNHQGARALAFKLIRYGYYWPTMKKDVSEYVKRCDRCQRFAVEYFTRWVEAEPLATISEPKLRTFTWRSIICRFGIPKVLITDNGRQFDNQQFRGFCSNLGIDHRLASVSHPQRNGLVEVTNRIILQDLRTRISNARDSWSDELPSILWTYRTTHRTTTGETPFMLAYGIEAMVPVEIRLPSHRRLEPETSRHTTEHLDLLEEVQEQTDIKVTSYQTRQPNILITKSRLEVQSWRLSLEEGRSSRSLPREGRAHLGRTL